MIKTAYLALSLALGLSSASLTHAQTQQDSKKTGIPNEAERKKLLKDLQDYLNSVKTLKTNFTQSDPKSGSLQHGSLVLRRGGNVRVQYNAPNNLIIVGQGGELRYYDHKMDKVNSTTLDSTPLGTLLAESVDLEKDVKVLDVRRSFGNIHLLVTKEGVGNGGYLVLVFSENPIVLRQWFIMDQKQQQINFSLINPVFNVDVEDRYFDLNSVRKRL